MRKPLTISCLAALAACSPQPDVPKTPTEGPRPAISTRETEHAFDRRGVAQAKAFKWLRTGTWKPIPTLAHGRRGIALVSQDQFGGRVLVPDNGGYAVYQAAISCGDRPAIGLRDGRHFSFGGGTAHSRPMKGFDFNISDADIATACKAPRKAGAQMDADSVARTLRRASTAGSGMDPAMAERLKQAQAMDPRSRHR